MSDLLIRGLPQKIHRAIQRKAESQNVSINQLLIQMIKADLQRGETEQEEEARRKEAFRRIRELREENFRQFGLSDDSTKLIREDRDSH